MFNGDEISFYTTKRALAYVVQENHARCVLRTEQVSTVVPARFVRIFSDFVSQIPELPVGYILHALLQNLYRRSHGPEHTGAYDALCEFQVMEAEKLQPFIEINHAFRHVVQAKELFMPAIDIGGGQALAWSVVPEMPRLF